MSPIEYFLENEKKLTTHRTILLYKLYADTVCDTTMTPAQKQAIYGLIVDDLQESLWHAIIHDPIIGNGFTRKYKFLQQIYADEHYVFTPNQHCRIQQLNRGITLRKINTPIINLIKSIF